MKVSKKVIKANVTKLIDLSNAIREYDKKISVLTWEHVGPLTEDETKELKEAREERTNLHGIRTGLWTAAELAGYDNQLADAMIEANGF